MTSTGWAAWGDQRPAPVTLVPVGAGDKIRYCPRCDKRTIWEARGDGVNACAGCGITVTTILRPDEIDRLERHYTRSIR
jgi:uncharacterized protein (DUF983 family)